MNKLGDLQEFIRIPRVAGLVLSPAGDALVAQVGELSADGKRYVSAIWRIDTAGGEPRRLTRSAPGESSPAFGPDGGLLFLSKRPDPAAAADDEADSADEEHAALWRLPAGGGEAERIVAAGGGVESFTVARVAGTIGYATQWGPTADSTAADEQWRTARRDHGVSAILHEGYPIRFWDHQLGPDQVHLAVAPPSGGVGDDVTADPGRSLDEATFALTPDGATLVTSWTEALPKGDLHTRLERVDTATGERAVLLTDPGWDFEAPQVSPDGRYVACLGSHVTDWDRPEQVSLWLVGIDGGDPRDLLAGTGTTCWPAEFAWSRAGDAIYFAADDQGRRPVFRVDLDSTKARPRRVTSDDAAYSALCPAPGGEVLYALRAAIDAPPTPVRIDAATGAVTTLAAPGTPLSVPGSMTEIDAEADDGARVRGWLVLPDGASAGTPAPLLVAVHGGPLSSWNSWHWRWNPWLLAARGYAVLLPDPAMSTGYGPEYIARGWGEWGPRTHADLMAITDATVARDDIDGERTGALGGSFGGYMANWLAGHTDRFRAIVSHAGLWALDQMHATTDLSSYWVREFGHADSQPERYERNSPHRHLDAIRTPMLVIHGNRDYRVPVGEALRLWWDLIRRDVPDVKFLYFPDENHWVLRPGNVVVWYQTVLNFLDQHVLGKPWSRPEWL